MKTRFSTTRTAEAPPKCRLSGFSLVEILCAILILGVSLAGLTRGITTALTSNKEAELQTSAAWIAAGRIETIRAEGFVMEGEDEGELQEGLSPYRWKQSITSTSIDGLYEVVVTIEQAQSSRSLYELRTLLFDPPTASTTTSSASRRSEDSREERRQRRTE